MVCCSQVGGAAFLARTLLAVFEVDTAVLPSIRIYDPKAPVLGVVFANNTALGGAWAYGAAGWV